MTAIPKTESASTDAAEDEAKLRAIREARASVEADGTVSHAEMMAWFRSLGAASDQPPAEPCG